ncbi:MULTISPECIES: Hpt domain-containing protein [unclassified Pseudoalteromonas]|uniref:HPt domain-containing protein n=2 Tax=Pseudoalteromonas amylolytica TaxID=1859457 RepID=A0A1S1N0U9_9GAMM|nr:MULTISPECIES: Hpt domain-containing protein [unclassified Pseudoalteromonas]MCF6434249.1 Hpt domain-containing protein [Pseudoalteromonas sp. MMG022]OHU85299.1 hypothetical protein BFC16_18235 [Pseudoalteromonas sp. JW3]OHU93079.1 hypothetical protein BET10_03480 [Pseudoalteromonas amylolytica]
MDVSNLDNLQVLNEQVMLELLGDDTTEINSFRQQFLQQAKSSLQKIAALYREQQFKQIKDEAHYLKTSAKAIGAERCAYYLQQIEDASLALDKVQCKQHIQTLSEEIKGVFRACSSQT